MHTTFGVKVHVCPELKRRVVSWKHSFRIDQPNLPLVRLTRTSTSEHRRTALKQPELRALRISSTTRVLNGWHLSCAPFSRTA